MTKLNFGRKQFSIQVAVHHQWKSRQEPGGRVEAEVMEWCCLLACPFMAWSACVHILPRTTCPGMGWALPHQSFIKKFPHRIAYEPMWWMLFLNLSSPSNTVVACIKLEKNLTRKQLKQGDVQVLSVPWLSSEVIYGLFLYVPKATGPQWNTNRPGKKLQQCRGELVQLSVFIILVGQY